MAGDARAVAGAARLYRLYRSGADRKTLSSDSTLEAPMRDSFDQRRRSNPSRKSQYRTSEEIAATIALLVSKGGGMHHRIEYPN